MLAATSRERCAERTPSHATRARSGVMRNHCMTESLHHGIHAQETSSVVRSIPSMHSRGAVHVPSQK